MRTRPQSITANTARAVTITELLVSIGLVALLVAIFLPGLAKRKARSSRLGCNNNMKQIGLAFCTWSLDNNDHFPMQLSTNSGGTMELVALGEVYPHFLVMSNELSTPKILNCPSDVKRSYATNFDAGLTDKNLSYFINMNATRDVNTSLLCGDRNLTNRAQTGNRLVALTRNNSIAWTKDLHREKGYLGFSDCTVDSFLNGTVGQAIKMVQGTNWIAVP